MPSSILQAGARTAGTGLTFTGGTEGAVFNSDDGDTSYASGIGVIAGDRFALTTITGGVITDVSIVWKGRCDGGTKPMTVGLYLGGSTTMGTERTLPNSASYTQYTESALACPDSGAWTPAKITSTELVVASSANTGFYGLITYIAVTVTYKLIGGFMFMSVFRLRRA